MNSGEQHREQRGGAEDHRPDPCRQFLQRPIGEGVAKGEGENAVGQGDPELTPARQPHPRHHGPAEQHDRGDGKPDSGAVERIELAVGEPHRHEVEPADEHQKRKSTEGDPVRDSSVAHPRRLPGARTGS